MAFVILLAIRRRVEKKFWNLLFLYLLSNFLIEFSANFLKAQDESNLKVYNIGMIFEITIFLLLFHRAVKTSQQKKMVLYSIISFLFFSTINALFFQNFGRFFSNTYTFGSIILMGVSLFYLFAIVVKNENHNPVNNFMFWFSIGVLFCYLGNLPYLSMLNGLISSKNKVPENDLAIISITVNTLLYVLIITGLICHRKVKK